jgi:hypothetical protein
MDPETQRKSVNLGLLLFLVFWLFFAGTIVTALLYLHFD